MREQATAALPEEPFATRRRRGASLVVEAEVSGWLALRLSRVSATFNMLPEELALIALGRMLALGDVELHALLLNQLQDRELEHG